MKRVIKAGIMAFLIILVATLAVSFLVGFFDIFRMVIVFFYIFFVSGFITTLNLFPISKSKRAKKDYTIDWFERIVLSFALSITLVGLIAFYLVIVGMKISLLNISLIASGIIIISVILFIRKLEKKEGKTSRK